MFPNRFAFPRVDALLDIHYRRISAPDSGFVENDGGLSFLLNPESGSVLEGDFVNIDLRFAYQDAYQDVQCEARCVGLLSDEAGQVGVFQFINAAPETLEGVRSTACLHMLRMNREEAAGKKTRLESGSIASPETREALRAPGAF
ncbi:MAG: hypothetical protein RIF32_15600 [Leptospirales bacterium]